MDYQNLLNDQQYKAVSTESQYTRIIAGAGSGKTRVLTYRIAYLLEHFNVAPTSILAIAFTNKVAQEMKERVVSLCPYASGLLRVSTFHSFCAKFLRQEIDLIGFPKNYTILDDDDQETLIKEIGVELGYKKNDEIVKSALSFVCAHKCAGHYPDDVVLPAHHKPEDKEKLKFFHLYEERKDKNLSLDFDDLLLRTIQILKEFPNVRSVWQHKFSNILIDEFQDTNDVQFELVKLLLTPMTNLYVVGDPDQTIYTWRGANQKIILNLNDYFKDTETIILDRNYRSTQQILEAANKLISNNKKRVPKNLYTKNTDGANVVYTNSFSAEVEAKNICEQISVLKITNTNFSYNDVAILYRAAYLTLPFEKEFMRRQLPYVIYGGIKFFQRKEIKDVLAYFRLIYNPSDDLSFERIINAPRRSIGETTLSLMKGEKERLNLSFYQYIQEIDQIETEVKTKTIVALQNMIAEIENVKKELDENIEAYPQLLKKFIQKIGYFEYLKNDDDADDRIENVETLFGDITEFLKKNKDSRFEDYLENAALQSSQDEVEDEEKIRLMTVHVAKGLEFKYVFVVGLNDGVFPSRRTIAESDDGIEEERRLCYVAFTRAKEKLFVSSNNSYSFILGSNTTASQFIFEAGLSAPIYRFHSENPRSEFNKKTTFSEIRDFSYSDFEPDEYPVEEEEIIWNVGDELTHDKFGDGVVLKIIDDTIIEVEFAEHGKKSLLAHHPMVHKKNKEGYVA